MIKKYERDYRKDSAPTCKWTRVTLVSYVCRAINSGSRLLIGIEKNTRQMAWKMGSRIFIRQSRPLLLISAALLHTSFFVNWRLMTHWSLDQRRKKNLCFCLDCCYCTMAVFEKKTFTIKSKSHQTFPYPFWNQISANVWNGYYRISLKLWKLIHIYLKLLIHICSYVDTK